jgi:hypothetical protein
MDRSERKYQYERYHEQFERQAILKSELDGLNPVEVFEKIFDGDVVSLIVEQSNLYSTQKNDHSFFKCKPVRFGYKDWMLCSASGYCYSFDTYCGAKNKSNNPGELRSMPLGSKIVLELLDALAVPSDHEVFFVTFSPVMNYCPFCERRTYVAQEL